MQDICDCIRKVARSEIVPRFNRTVERIKDDGSVVTECDAIVQQQLESHLLNALPGSRLLGEEMSVQQQSELLQSAGKLWCVDPLDGTSNFAGGIPFFSVSVALIEQGKVQFGAVYDPCRDEMFYATIGEGAFLNGQKLINSSAAKPLKHCMALIDFKRLPQKLAGRLATEPPYRSQRSFGSVALDWCWIAAARGDIYLHGKQKMWDYAAGCLILAEAGGSSGTLSGEAVFQSTLEGRSAVAALNQQIYTDWLNYCRD